MRTWTIIVPVGNMTYQNMRRPELLFTFTPHPIFGSKIAGSHG